MRASIAGQFISQPAIVKHRDCGSTRLRFSKRFPGLTRLGTAYSYISSADRIVQDKSTYIQSEVSLNGFALELARRLTAGMDVWVIEQKIGPTKAHFEVGYRVPTADELSPRLFDWNPDKLNRLSPAEQSALIEAIEKAQEEPKKNHARRARNLRSGFANRRLENLL